MNFEEVIRLAAMLEQPKPQWLIDLEEEIVTDTNKGK